MTRYATQARVQSQFLDDALHQLRMLLSVLRTQTGVCLARNMPPGGPYSPSGDVGGLGQGGMCTTNQMLALARAKDASLPEAGFAPEPVDLAELAHRVIRGLLPTARAR